jgi:predicted RecA/RadA family phage recombinase
VRNYVQPGEYGLTVTAPGGGVTSGQVVIIGAIVGIAATTQSAGAPVELATEGIYDLAKVAADALAVGAVAKVVTSSGLVGVAGTASIGWVVQAAASGSATARVKLTPSVAGTPTTALETQTHETHTAQGKR